MPPRGPIVNRRAEITVELRNSIIQLEEAGNDYARFLPLHSVVSAEMINIEGDFAPPKVAFDAFKRLRTRPPLKVTGLNLDLSYDTGVRYFNIEHGEVDFDNGYGLAFLEPEVIASESEMHHPVKIFRRGAKGHVNTRGLGLTSASVVQDFFRECGVHISLSPHPAEWSSIMPMLAASQSKVVTATARTNLDPDRTLIVAKQTIETALPKASSGRKRKAERIQELSLQLVNYEGVAARSLEAVLRTNTRQRPPHFQALYEHSDARVLIPPKGALGRALCQNDSSPEIETVELKKSRWLEPHIKAITAAVLSASNFQGQ